MSRILYTSDPETKSRMIAEQNNTAIVTAKLWLIVAIPFILGVLAVIAGK